MNEHTPANARLIAAAPELYDLVIDLMEVCDDLRLSCQDIPEDIRRRLDAALIRANGVIPEQTTTTQPDEVYKAASGTEYIVPDLP